MNRDMLELVQLVCIEEGSKLRVRIVSDGYIKTANCQFLREIRMKGRQYLVNPIHIRLITRRGKWFYSIQNKNAIQIVSEGFTIEKTLDIKNIKIYEDDIVECGICMDKEKQIVFYPCGHYYCCSGCSQRVKLCPICRQTITNYIDRTLIE